MCRLHIQTICAALAVSWSSCLWLYESFVHNQGQLRNRRRCCRHLLLAPKPTGSQPLANCTIANKGKAYSSKLLSVSAMLYAMCYTSSPRLFWTNRRASRLLWLFSLTSLCMGAILVGLVQVFTSERTKQVLNQLVSQSINMTFDQRFGYRTSPLAESWNLSSRRCVRA